MSLRRLVSAYRVLHTEGYWLLILRVLSTCAGDIEFPNVGKDIG